MTSFLLFHVTFNLIQSSHVPNSHMKLRCLLSKAQHQTGNTATSDSPRTRPTTSRQALHKPQPHILACRHRNAQRPPGLARSQGATCSAPDKSNVAPQHQHVKPRRTILQGPAVLRVRLWLQRLPEKTRAAVTLQRVRGLKMQPPRMTPVLRSLRHKRAAQANRGAMMRCCCKRTFTGGGLRSRRWGSTCGMHGVADELRRCGDCAGQVCIDDLRLGVAAATMIGSWYAKAPAKGKWERLVDTLHTLFGTLILKSFTLCPSQTADLRRAWWTHVAHDRL